MATLKSWLVLRPDTWAVTHIFDDGQQPVFVGGQAVVFDKHYGIGPAGKVKAYATGFVQAVLHIGNGDRIHAQNREFYYGNTRSVGLAIAQTISKGCGLREGQAMEGSDKQERQEKRIAK